MIGVRATVTVENAVQNAARVVVPHRSTSTSCRDGFRYHTTASASAAVTTTPTRNTMTGFMEHLLANSIGIVN